MHYLVNIYAVKYKSTIKSNVNGRQFSVVMKSDLDWRLIDVIYFLSWEEKDCGIQYVDQTCRFLKTRFTEHYRFLKKPRKIDNFFIDISNTLIILLVILIFSPWKRFFNKRYRNIHRHELELKWIKLLHSQHPLGFYDNIYHEGNISRLLDFDGFFSLLDIRKT